MALGQRRIQGPMTALGEGFSPGMSLHKVDTASAKNRHVYGMFHSFHRYLLKTYPGSEVVLDVGVKNISVRILLSRIPLSVGAVGAF